MNPGHRALLDNLEEQLVEGAGQSFATRKNLVVTLQGRGAIVMLTPATILAAGRCLPRLANLFSDKAVASPSCFITAVGAAGVQLGTFFHNR